MRLRASAAALAGAGAYAAYKYKTDEGFQRALMLYGNLGPVVIHYRLVETKQAWWPHGSKAAASAEWRRLDRMYASKVVRQLEELQGMYTKYGQIASGMTNTFSSIWTEELRKLEDAVPPRSTEIVMQTILEETGRPVSETFSSFDEKPLGSASIGQVHRAILRSTGEEVAVKVQYPNASRLFRSDMATIRGFCKIFAPEQVVTLGELERNFEFEFDYLHEAANLLEVRTAMLSGEGQSLLLVNARKMNLLAPQHTGG